MNQPSNINRKIQRARNRARKIRRMGLPILVLLVALFRPLIATDQPLFLMENGKLQFPAFHELPAHWRLESEAPVLNEIKGITCYALIPFHPQRIDISQKMLPPGSEVIHHGKMCTHWLGTDHLGRDVAAGLCQGLYIALLVGLGSMMLAFIIAIPLGWLAAWNKKYPYSIKLIQFIALLMLPLIVIIQWNLIKGHAMWSWGSLLSISAVILLFIFIAKRRYHTDPKRKEITLAFDRWILQFAALLDSIPGLLWVLVLGALFGPGLATVVGIIAWVRLPEIIRLSQLEAERIQTLSWSESAVVAGIPTFRIWWRHWWPAQWPVLQTIFLYGVISGVVLESTLSFLGLGMPFGQVSWGSLINGARSDMSAWWLVLFPGLLLVLFIQWLKRWAKRLEKID